MSRSTARRTWATVTASNVCFDSWAWFEVLHETSAGQSLSAAYLGNRRRVFSSVLVLAELASKLDMVGAPPLVRSGALGLVRSRAELVDVTEGLATEGGFLRGALRERSRDASLVDGIMLATARSKGAVLVSNDPAFRGQPDVVGV